MTTDNDKILVELIQNQKKTVPNDKKLLYNDLRRISKYLSRSIFCNECSLWNGYVTTIKNDDKSSYINFYFNGKKYALHRLLYQNYVGELSDGEYIKFNCPNKGKCCAIGHFYKIFKTETDEKSGHSTENIDKIKTEDNDLTSKNSTHDTSSNSSGNKTPEIKPKESKSIIVDFNL